MPDDTVRRWPKIVAFTDTPLPTLAPLLSKLGPPFSQGEFSQVQASDLAQWVSANGDRPINWIKAVNWLRQQQFDAALILTVPGQSPYTLGYLCYLAGIPVRVGRSLEFGGQVLTHCWEPQDDRGAG